MSSHLEIWKPSGRELITLSGQRVIVGQASTNLVSLKHDAIRLALACRLGKPRVCLVDTGCGQSQWHLSQWRKDRCRTGPAFWRRVASRQFTVDLLGGKAS